MSFAIRPYHPSDLYALYRICLLTGASGNDASHLFRDPELLGHFFAAPYAVFEPELAFVLTNNGAPCGYVLGTADSAMFADRMENEWLPTLRERYPLPPEDDRSEDAQMIRRLYAGRFVPPHADRFPAHLHIDILPEGQGQGLGQRLIHTLLDRMRALGIPAVHLGVASDNQRAIRFYERVGFTIIPNEAGYLVYGMLLAPASTAEAS